jgi:hypothetical protein
MVEVFAEDGEAVGVLLEEAAGVEVESVFLLGGEFPGEEAGAEEDEVSIEGIAEAVVVDFLESSLAVELVDLIAGDIDFSGEADEACEEVESAGEGVGAAIGEPIEQIDDGGAVAVAVEEVLREGYAEAEGG